MRFAILVVIDVVAKLAGLGAAVITAIAGWGYWALVMQQVGTAIVTLGATTPAARWIPRAATRCGLSRSGTVLAHTMQTSNAVSYAADNVDSLMIGLLLGSAPLGLYNRAFQLFLSPVMAFFSPLTTVVVPTANWAVAEGKSASDILARTQTALCGSSIGLLLVTSSHGRLACATPAWGAVARHCAAPSDSGTVCVQGPQPNELLAYLIEQQSRQYMLSSLINEAGNDPAGRCGSVLRREVGGLGLRGRSRDHLAIQLGLAATRQV